MNLSPKYSIHNKQARLNLKMFTIYTSSILTHVIICEFTICIVSQNLSYLRHIEIRHNHQDSYLYHNCHFHQVVPVQPHKDRCLTKSTNTQANRILTVHHLCKGTHLLIFQRNNQYLKQQSIKYIGYCIVKQQQSIKLICQSRQF